MISGRVSVPVSDTFLARFGVPLRQVYGTTETGPITLDSSPVDRVRSQTAGTPLPGAAVIVGDDPDHPSADGVLGKIWARTPWSMDGYGFPGSIEPVQTVNGWWSTPDVGYRDDASYVTVAGRADACIRTAAGYLVNPDEVAAAIERYRGVTRIKRARRHRHDSPAPSDERPRRVPCHPRASPHRLRRTLPRAVLVAGRLIALSHVEP